MSEDLPEPPRQVWHFALIVLFCFIMLISQAVARRPLLARCSASSRIVEWGHFSSRSVPGVG